MKFSKGFLFVIYMIFVVLLIRSFQIVSVDAAKAIFVFGDSFTDTGNGENQTMPYGMTWPGYPTGRACDGRNQADFFAEFFDLPSPTPFWQLKKASQAQQGVNFGRRGAGVTYSFGNTPLGLQVDQLGQLVQKGVLTKDHLNNSVALVSIGVNDYGSRNKDRTFKESTESQELTTTIRNIVDGIALNVVRLYGFGLHNIIVSNLANMPCSPFITAASNYTICSTNTTLLIETSTHNSLLQERVKSLNQELSGVHIIIVDLTKTFDHLFHNGSKYGFVDPLTPCCPYCSNSDSTESPSSKLCSDPSKFVIFDTIHPTEAAWKVVVNLYAYVEGFTQEGPKLHTWIKKYNV